VLELVEPSSKNIEVAIVDRKGLRIMPSDDIDEIVKLIEDEKEYADKQRKTSARQQAMEAHATAKTEIC
jgi:20S proteasome subunit alpha 4/ATP-dependent RNA helicase DDX56/DBP9